MSKVLIYSENKLNEGLFGEIFLWIFEILPILENNNLDVNNLFWYVRTKSYGSIFPEILDYVNNDKNFEQPMNNVIDFFELRNLTPQYVLGDNFSDLNKLFFKYFKIPKQLNDVAASLNLKEYLGLHFRGTDKTIDTNFNTPVSKEIFYTIVDSYISANNIKNIFIASDENDVFDYFVNKYTKINFKSSRDFKGNLFWRNNENPLVNAKMAMLDMLCLSNCNTVLKISSALSSFSKVVNPSLNIYRINALKFIPDPKHIPYFPDAYIPLLPTNAKYTQECNDLLTEIQRDDWSIQHPNIYKFFNNFDLKIRKRFNYAEM
jgi:hypothetical protein